MLGLSVLLFTLKQVGLIGPAEQPLGGVASRPLQSSPVGPNTARAADVPSSSPAAPVPEAVNLLNTDEGAQLITVNQLNEIQWPTLFTGIPTTAGIYANGYAVLALTGDQMVTVDTLAIFVDRTWASMSVKELAVYTSSTSHGGPFGKAAQISVPNYQNMQKPFHEVHFAPVEARFVKLQVLSFHPGAPGNLGLVGSIRLYASRTSRRF